MLVCVLLLCVCVLCVQESHGIISALVTCEPASRLGFTSGAVSVKKHPFFGSIDWKNLDQIAPPTDALSLTKEDPE